MKNLLIILCCLSLSIYSSAQKDYLTPFEQNENTSTTYDEMITYYEQLANDFPEVQIKEVGLTDVGRPLHLVILAKDRDFTPERTRASSKTILFINNGIHAGEACGVDASMMFARDMMQNRTMKSYLDHMTIAIIPFYNVGGGLNRNSTTRTNQNGPESYGFRANAQNLDLNRDFIKCDSKNARTFNQIYTEWLPDVFIDNHTSNGADYQYTITLIATQHNKLEPQLADYMNTEMLPYMYKYMKQSKWEMTPYVYARSTPDEGIAGFIDLPRYSSGYAALYNAFSFMPETHMLKPFKDRVRSVYTFMQGMVKFMDKEYDAILSVRKKAEQSVRNQSRFPISWSVDREKSDTILFKGYEAKYKKSAITGADRLYYDHDAPFEKKIPFFNHYKTTNSVLRPTAYIIPQSAYRVIDRMKWNNVKMERLKEDIAIEVEVYYIKDYKTSQRPYEGHYLHSRVEVEKKKETVQYRKGDYVIFINQIANRYIVETLEPQAPDAFFAWNFFDGILQRKEHFSSYVFEDLAVEILKNRPDIKEALDAKKAADEKFADNPREQIQFIYEQSDHAEKSYNRYPIGRLLKYMDLEFE